MHLAGAPQHLTQPSIQSPKSRNKSQLFYYCRQPFRITRYPYPSFDDCTCPKEPTSTIKLRSFEFHCLRHTFTLACELPSLHLKATETRLLFFNDPIKNQLLCPCSTACSTCLWLLFATGSRYSRLLFPKQPPGKTPIQDTRWYKGSVLARCLSCS